MAKWVAECVTSKKVTAEELAATTEFLVSLGEHRRRGAIDDRLAAQGQKFFAEGKDEVTACFDCHAMKVTSDPDGLFEGGSSQIATGAPDLTGYASAAWLRDFISDPGEKRFYGSHNAMQKYAGQLTERELELIVDFLLQNWDERPNPRNGTQHSGQ
jgi:mono/diheme cytochrome c family protein